jgi:hypothetical protein
MTSEGTAGAVVTARFDYGCKNYTGLEQTPSGTNTSANN